MKHASIIFDDVKMMLLTIDECKQGVPNDKIEEQSKLNIDAFGQFDTLLAFLHMPNGNVFDADAHQGGTAILKK